MAMRMMGVAEVHEAKCVGGQAAKDCPNKAHPGPGQLSYPNHMVEYAHLTHVQ